MADAGHDEKKVGEAVEVAPGDGVDRLAGFGEADDHAFGAACQRAREVKIGGARRAAGKNKGGKRRQGLVELVDLRFEPSDLAVGDAKGGLAGAACVRDSGEVGAEIEEIVLGPPEHCIDRGHVAE